MALSRLTIDLAVGLAGFESDMGRAATITQRQVRKMERDFSRFASIAGAALGGAVVAGFAQATRAAAQFEKSMAEVSTLLDDTSSLDSMTESVKDLAKEFGKAPTEQASALYQIISSGAEAGAEAIEILTASNKLAVGGITDLKTAADGLTSVLNVYGDEAGTVSEISDKFFAAMKAGKTTVGELAGAIGPVVNIAKELGVSFDELVAAASTVTQSGVSTSQAFNSLKAALANVVKPSKEAQETAKELGINFSGAALQSQGLAKFLDNVKRAAGGNVEVMTRLFGSVEGLAAVLSLTGSGADAFAETLDSIQNSVGETDKAVTAMKDTVSQAFAELSSAIQVQLIDAGSAIDQVLVPAIRALTENIDEVVNAMKVFGAVMATVLIARLAATAVQVARLTATVGALRAATIVLGGPISAVTVGLTAATLGMQHLWKEAQATQRVIESLTQTISMLTEEWVRAASAAELVAAQGQVRQQWLETEEQLLKVQERLAKLRADTPDDLEKYHAEIKQLADEEQRLLDIQGDAVDKLVQMGQQLKRTRVDGWEPIVATAKRITEWFGEASGAVGDFDDSVRMSNIRVKMIRNEFDKWVRVLQEVGEAEREAASELDAYNRELQRLRDIGDPVGALVRQFQADLEILGRELKKNADFADEYQRILNVLSDRLGQAAAATQDASDEFDKWGEAAAEAVRILERTFTDAWQGIRDGFSGLLDGLADGFRTLLASMMHDFFTSPLIRSLDAYFKEGKPFDFSTIGTALGGIGGFALGSFLGGGGEWANLGSAFGTLFGEAAFAAIFPSLFAGLGSFAGPIGSIIGGLLGGLVGGLFDDAPDFELQLVGSGLIGDPVLQGRTGPFVGTSLGGFNVTNTGDFASEDVEKLVQGMVDFDNAFAQFLNAGQLEEVTELLKNWGTELDGAAVSLEAFITSRLDQIQFALDGAVLAWVNSAENLQEEIARTGAAFLTENLFEQRPELFLDRTQQEFLAVVEAFKDGTETITDAFNEVIRILDQVVSITSFLESFAGSNLTADFDALLALENRSIGQALADANSQLMDAVANFDGSIAGLQNIAQLVSTVREGEIRYLSQLNQLQQGLNASLDTLRADIQGLTEAPATGAQLFNQARQLAFDVQQATTPEEVAALQQQFNALIRSIEPEDARAIQAQILQLIDAFQAAANDTIDRFRQDAVDNAQTMRDLVDVFINDIGDPLAIIAASNERAAAALEALSGTQPVTGEDEAVVGDGDQMLLVDSIVTANAEAAQAQQQIMATGLSEIALAVERGGNVTAAAVLQGISQVNWNATFVVQDASLVNR